MPEEEKDQNESTKPDTPAEPTQTSKPNNTGSIALIIIVTAIVVAGLIIGGWYGYKYFKNNKKGGATATTTSTTTATVTTSSTTSSATATGAKSGTMPTNGYVIADSDTKVLIESDLTSFTPWQLKVARNEIYARRGRPFVHKDLQCYFAKQSWYRGDPNFSESSLNAVEKKNVETIKNYEIKINSPFYQTDSGC